MAEPGKMLKPKMVNVRQVFRDKNPRLAALIPGFIYRYLERIVHQEDLNGFLTRFGHKFGLEFAQEVYATIHRIIDYGSSDPGIQHICLELHEQIVVDHTPIDFQGFQGYAGCKGSRKPAV